MNDISDTELDGIRLFDVETLVDPYAAYKKLRDEDPVHYLPDMNVHVIMRYDLIREIMRDTETYSNDFGEFMESVRLAPLQGLPDDVRRQLEELYSQQIPEPPTLLTIDEPEHSRYRSLVSRLFTAGQIKRSEDQVRATVAEHADRYVAQPSGSDFMWGFAFPVPLQVIGDRLGIPHENRGFFNDAATAIADELRMNSRPPEERLRRAQLVIDLQKLLIRLMETRRTDPQEDMITILANARLDGDDRPLEYGEALSILRQFLGAGHETTTTAFGWGMLLLCKNPELQDELHRDPTQIKTFVEETLRIEAPVQSTPRLVTRDTELDGYPLKAGSMLMLRYGSGNRDERQFEDPDRVDVHRDKAGMHLSFGTGIHHCIGAPLARQELNLGFAALLERMKNIRLSESHPEPKAEPSLILRSLPHLYIDFDQR